VIVGTADDRYPDKKQKRECTFRSPGSPAYQLESGEFKWGLVG